METTTIDVFFIPDNNIKAVIYFINHADHIPFFRLVKVIECLLHFLSFIFSPSFLVPSPFPIKIG